MLNKLKNSDYKLWLCVALWILFILAVLYFIIFYDFQKPEDQDTVIQSRETLSQFSNKLTIEKTGSLLPDSEVEILSDTNGKVARLNFSEWDYVKKWWILMQIYGSSSQYADLMDDAKAEITDLQLEYETSQINYNESISAYTQQIQDLEDQIKQLELEISAAILQWDIEQQAFLELQINKLEKQITNLQLQYEIAVQNNNSNKNNIEWQIQSARNRYDTYYTQSNQLTPRATINWTISKIFVQVWDAVHDGDPLLTITSVNEVPTLSVELSFDEYKLTESLSSVYVRISNWDKYEWVISSRSQTTNENWLYEILIEVVENIMDEEWNPESTSKFLQEWQTYTVELPIISEWIWLPNRCLSKIWLSECTILIREWDVAYDKTMNIISKWNDWTLVDNFIVSDIDQVLCDVD